MPPGNGVVVVVVVVVLVVAVVMVVVVDVVVAGVVLKMKKEKVEDIHKVPRLFLPCSGSRCGCPRKQVMILHT